MDYLSVPINPTGDGIDRVVLGEIDLTSEIPERNTEPRF